MSDGYESLIASAILGDDADKATAMRRVTCKAAASRKMFCHCGDILDQSTVVVIERHNADRTESVLAASCPKCVARAEKALRELATMELITGGKIVLITWNAKTIIEPV